MHLLTWRGLLPLRLLLPLCLEPLLVCHLLLASLLLVRDAPCHFLVLPLLLKTVRLLLKL